MSENEQPPQGDEPKTILELLKSYSRVCGVDRYNNDSEKVKLILEYLWLRQLVPSLPFETFLDCYVAVADFDQENMKRPHDAVAHYLPRSKKTAGDRRQWTSREVVDYLSLYVDVIRLAEQQNTPVPMTLNQFLQNETLLQRFLAGDFKEAPTPAARKPAKKKVKKAALAPAAEPRAGLSAPLQPGSRAIYTDEAGRQYRGYIRERVAIAEGEDRMVLVSDAGERFEGLPLSAVTLCSDPPPVAPSLPDGTPLPVLGEGGLGISPVQFSQAQRYLALSSPCGTVKVGDAILRWDYAYPDGLVASVAIVNGEDRPYVDCWLHAAEDHVTAVAEVPPRYVLAGDYTLVTENGFYRLIVEGGT